MINKKGLASILFIFSFYLGFASTQYYESYLTNDNLTAVTPTSYISWGYIDVNYLELSRINSGNDGFIEFSIEPTDFVEVSLTKESNDNARFGFVFKNNNVTVIQIDGVEISLPTISYVYTDVFKVLKCGIVIKFFKNGERLYEHCNTDLAANLLHTTHVATAQNTRLTLTFESDISDCSNMYAGETPEELLLVDNEGFTADTDVGVDAPVARENSTPETIKNLPGNRIIIADVFSQDGIPVKQFRIRTTLLGTIPASHAIYDYMEKSYKIKFKEAKK